MLSIYTIATVVILSQNEINLNLTGPMMTDSDQEHLIVQTLNSATEKDNITIYFNSVGGQVDSGYRIYNAIKWTKAKIICDVKMAGSMAAVVLSACPKVKALPDSVVVIHVARDNNTPGHKFNSDDPAIQYRFKTDLKNFRKIFKGMLTNSEEFNVFIGKEDLEMSGDEFIARKNGNLWRIK